MSGELSNSVSAGSRMVEAMQFPPLRFVMPRVGKEVERLRLESGLTLFLQPERSLPLVRLHLRGRGGTLHECRENHNLAGLAAYMLRVGGTASYTPEKFDELLELNGIKIKVQARLESTSIDVTCLSDNLSQALHLLGEMLTRPRYDEAKLVVLMEQVHEELRRRNDYPDNIVYREFAHLLFGDDPQGYDDDWEKIARISVDDVRSWNKVVWAPQRSLMAVSGDFDAKEFVALLREHLGEWQIQETTLAPIVPLAGQAHKGHFLIDRDISQSYICLGNLGVHRAEEHLEDIEVANYILGGGSFSSRLMDTVRTRYGLAYSIHSCVDLSCLRPGRFLVAAQTKVEHTARVLDLVLQAINTLQNELVSPAELEHAVEALRNSTMMAFNSGGAAARAFLHLEVIGRASDYFERYLENLSAVSRESVREAAQRVYKPQDLLYVVVSNLSQLREVWAEASQLNCYVPKSFD